MASMIVMRWCFSRRSKPTHRALQGGKRWHKGDAAFIKGVWVGRSETSDEHIVLTLGGRVLSRTISCALANNSKTGADLSPWCEKFSVR